MEFWILGGYCGGIFGWPTPSSAGVLVFFGRFLCVVVKEGIEMEYWVVLEGLEIY